MSPLSHCIKIYSRGDDISCHLKINILQLLKLFCFLKYTVILMLHEDIAVGYQWLPWPSSCICYGNMSKELKKESTKIPVFKVV